jgi:hypothetical protein
MTEIRIDNILMPKVSVTKEGYLRGDAIVTRSGVFKYQNLDGSTRLELRHPDDILAQSSLDTLKSIPITNDHPTELVNIDNVGNLLVGMTGETVKIDGDFIISTLTITDKDTIKAINKGKREFSLGYKVDVVEEKGMFNGEEYTHRQTNVDYNHLALVEVGRAGRSARVNLDGALMQVDNITDKEDLGMVESDKKDVDKVEKVIDNNNKADEVSRNDPASVSLDKYLGIIDQLKLENAELKAVRVDSIIADRVKNRIELINKTKKVINVDSDELSIKSDREIMELVINSVDKTVKLDDKSDAYVNGRFDAIVDMNSGNNAIKRQMDNIKRTDGTIKHLDGVELLKEHFNNLRKNNG